MGIQVGIIGLGAVGERLLHKFLEHPETEVAAICDANGERLKTFQEKLPDVQFYTDYKSILADAKIDLVYVAVPPKFHHQIALEVIRAGKPILCEKPLANSYQEAVEMAEAAKKAGVVHAINFPTPYSSVYPILKDKLESGSIGQIKRLELHMYFQEWPREWQHNPWIAKREQGGFVREVSPHFLQVIIDLLGPVQNVYSQLTFPEDPTLCETGIIAHAELQDGTPILINGLSGVGQKEHLAFKIYGDKGVLSLVNWSQLVEETLETPNTIIPTERKDSLLGLIDELVKALKGEPARLVNFDRGIEVQYVLEKLLGHSVE
ncbi:Gfo/Idh/MocA family protein [Bacillus litorisediminis]|uniref:Gfo/Idh/MocA family protein n=1 Tax=Bacillus litorisediminis TaxID=2922713 RepID=UPI001FB03CBF|nr:Gfo/Idh/MocA family oxidoreductase [Bacillus litorisediminis]